MMIAREPAVGLHRCGQDWQGGQGLEDLAWWSIATGPPLMWPLMIVVLLICLRNALHLFEILRVMHLETLLLVTPVVPFHKRVFIGSMWWANARFHSHCCQET